MFIHDIESHKVISQHFHHYFDLCAYPIWNHDRETKKFLLLLAGISEPNIACAVAHKLLNHNSPGLPPAPSQGETTVFITNAHYFSLFYN